MRIGIDIDGVVTDLYGFVLDYFSKFLVENNIDYKITNSSYDFATSFSVSEELEDKFWDKEVMNYACNINARPFVGEVINKLKSEGHEIIFITARHGAVRQDEFGKNMREAVVSLLEKNGIYYDKLVYSKGSKEGKVDEILENKIDIMIEDNPNNIIQLSKYANIICYDACYNRQDFADNVVRCYSWYDIYNTINKMSKA